MFTLTIIFREGHLFVKINGWFWRFENGATESLANQMKLSLMVNASG
jgi:hypothetical protein